MSKKKAFSGNTMTLKDFHGGSIPSDIPLPSAPGVYVCLRLLILFFCSFYGCSFVILDFLM